MSDSSSTEALGDVVRASGHVERSALVARVHALEEALAQTRVALTSAEDALGALSASHGALERRLALRASVEACLRTMPEPTTRASATTCPAPASTTTPAHEAPYVFDAARDRAFANEDPRFDHVCHLFHQEWLGVRAAAGALPGHKLALRADRPLGAHEIEHVVTELDRRRVRTVAIHAWSPSMHALVRALRALTDTRLVVVWHGTTTQWAHADERSHALGALAAARDGLVHDFAAIRRGMEPLTRARTEAPQLLNAPPKVRVPTSRAPRRADACLALAPSWNDLRKNLTTNVLATQAVPRIARAFHLTEDLALPTWLAPRLERVPYRAPRQMLELMATVDVVANATTIDCHPMVDLEALAVDTPTVRGPLFLDALEDHPYARATVVENALSVADVARALERVLSTPTSELDDMMRDYRERLRALSLERYAERLAP